MYEVETLYMPNEEMYAWVVYSDKGNLMFYSHTLYDTREEALDEGRKELSKTC